MANLRMFMAITLIKQYNDGFKLFKYCIKMINVYTKLHDILQSIKANIWNKQ